MLRIFETFRKALSLILTKFNLFRDSERRVRWFIHSDIYYIIRVSYPTTGILAIVKTTLQHIIYAVECGYIPVVDLRNNPCQYQKSYEFGHVNVWEKFFKQPRDIGLSGIPFLCNIILSSKSFAPPAHAHSHKNYFIDVSVVLPKHRIRLCEIAKSFRQYIRPTQVVADAILKRYNHIREMCAGKRVLGVLCRGTDYTLRHPHGHPIQPSAEEVIDKIKAEREMLQFSKIFLATEDKTVLDKFQKAFGSSVITIGQRMIDLGNKQYISELEKDNYDFFDGPVAYISAMYVLSRCDYFIGGMTSGTLFAFLLSQTCGFKYEYVFDLGHYQ